MLKYIATNTAYKFTQTPTLFSTIHIVLIIVIFSVCFSLAYLLRGATERQNNIILFSLGLILLIAEIYKISFYYYNIGHNHIVWKIFPFQLCSLAMYICLIIPFIKKQKTKISLYNFLIAFNFPGGLISILIPNGLLHKYITLTIHAYVWHSILLFIGFYLFLNNRAGFSKNEFKSSLKYFYFTVIIALIINTVFHKAGYINMFYISPFYNSPIFFFRKINAQYGWFINFILYTSAMVFGCYLANLPFYSYHRGHPEVKTKNYITN